MCALMQQVRVGQLALVGVGMEMWLGWVGGARKRAACMGRVGCAQRVCGCGVGMRVQGGELGGGAVHCVRLSHLLRGGRAGARLGWGWRWWWQPLLLLWCTLCMLCSTLCMLRVLWSTLCTLCMLRGVRGCMVRLRCRPLQLRLRQAMWGILYMPCML